MDTQPTKIETGVVQVLLALKQEAIRRRGLGRLYTIKAVCALGRDWHTSGEVMTWLSPYTHTNYVFEIASKWPNLVELNTQDKKVRINPKAYLTVVKMIDGIIKEVGNSTQS